MIGIARRRIPLLTEDEDEYEFVDLGLPSGLLWAKCNVGAETETDYGLYFSWGETTGYVNASSKTNRGATGFTWGSYEHITGTSGYDNKLTKYNSTDGKTVLDLEDDAAHVNMGGNWRMPTIGEYQELIKNTTNKWVTTYNGKGVAGRVFTSKTDPNIKLFFPAAGYCHDASVDYTGSWSHYWSSSLLTSYRLSSRRWHADYAGTNTQNDENRRYGLSVRAVRDA